MNQPRDIKFRAFDTKTNKMIDTGFHILGEIMAFGLIESYIQENMCGADSFLDRLNDIKISQFTGLKDKHGADIYEGDIVETRIYDGWFDKEGFLILFVVYYNQSEAAFKIALPGAQKAGYKGGEMSHAPLWVVGNIFENPKLLEK